MRTPKHLTIAGTLVGVLAIGSFGSGPLASAASTHDPANSIETAGSKARSNVLITTRTVVPKAQRTVHFTGYATYTFRAPSNRRILSASARIVGAQAHAVAIRAKSISQNLESYTVSLVFPGEQGNPGKLVVRLASVS